MTFVASELSKEIQGRVLYRDVSFRLEPGKTLAVLGPSGAGKSQLLRQLAGLDCATPEFTELGRVSLDGKTRQELGAFEWRATVSRVPQHVPRLDGTPAEFAQRIAAFRVQRSRPFEDARGLASSYGLADASWEQPWAELSVGERQRALLAVFLSRRPSVLLLDEPTAALDADSVQAVEASLRDCTCVWVTHNTEQAERVANDTLLLGNTVHAD